MGKAEQNFEAQREATLGSPHAEASRMLEAALQQMDGIISGARLDAVDGATTPGSGGGASVGGGGGGGGGGGTGPPSVLEAAEQLVAALQRAPPLPPPPAPGPASAAILLQWLGPQLPNDMENYTEYHIMGSVSQVRMKPGCMPRKFTCQQDRIKRTSDTKERPYIAKKQRIMLLEQCEKEFTERSIVTEQSSSEEIASGSSGSEDSSPEDESTLKCADGGGGGATWSDASTTSTSDMTTSSSDEEDEEDEDEASAPGEGDGGRLSAEDRSTTGCGGDFQWLRSNPGARLCTLPPTAPTPPRRPDAEGGGREGAPRRPGARGVGATPRPASSTHDLGGARPSSLPRPRGLSATPPPGSALLPPRGASPHDRASSNTRLRGLTASPQPCGDSSHDSEGARPILNPRPRGLNATPHTDSPIAPEGACASSNTRPRGLSTSPPPRGDSLHDPEGARSSSLPRPRCLNATPSPASSLPPREACPHDPGDARASSLPRTRHLSASPQPRGDSLHDPEAARSSSNRRPRGLNASPPPPSSTSLHDLEGPRSSSLPRPRGLNTSPPPRGDTLHDPDGARASSLPRTRRLSASPQPRGDSLHDSEGARASSLPRPRGLSATPPPPPGPPPPCCCGVAGSRSHSLERGRTRRAARHRRSCCCGAHCCHHALPPCAAAWEAACGCGCGCAWRSRSLCRWEHAPSPSPARTTLCAQGASEVEERVRRLEADKEQLQLQVAVLAEQIDVQTEKISDLEKALGEKKQQLASAENMLQTEMLARSSLETHKLELLSGISELKLQQAALERENLELRERLSEERRRNKPPLAPRTALHATSTPFSSPAQNAQLILGGSPSPSPVSSMSDGSPRRLGNEDIPQPRTPPANFRRKVDHYGSLPRQRTGSGSTMPPLEPNLLLSGSGRKGVAFAETESTVIEDQPAPEETNGMNSFSPQPSPLLQPQKNKGIKKIFGRMKRSNSGTLEDLGDGDFRRGGVRATAGARLGWGIAATPSKPDLPFAQWDSEAISQWLTDLGLECYANDARRWVKTGTQLLSASTHEIDKELGIKSPLHRKKLQLALLCEAENGIVKPEDPHLMSASRLDTAWVLRWLDDVGLPQHKESFLAARVDGRVLHRLTVDDLSLLHLSSSLQVASLRRGIQVLRDHGFDPNCLLRRSLPEENGAPTPQEVARWTNHRVMEWLRVVDLAEYAPNLRGSGVHGGLMVHEPRFTAELLASLLSIPPSKTLLRRHLNTHFKELLGRECIQEKREAESTLGYVPLSATTKVKLAKKSQFTLKRKKSKAELDMGDLVCPLDPSKPGEGSPQTPPLHLHGDGMSPASKAPKAGAASQGTDSNSLAESSASDRTSTV